MNSIVQIRQISQYPDADPVFPDDRVVLQRGSLGGPYLSSAVANLVATALMLPAGDGTALDLELAPGRGLNWEGFPDAFLRFGAINDDRFFFGRDVVMPGLEITSSNLRIGGAMAATIDDVNALAAHSVQSFNGRSGIVQLSEADVLRAGAAPVRNAHFSGWITAPSLWDTRANDDTVATVNWVHRAIAETGVSSFMGRTGDIVLTTSDINVAYANALPGVYPTAPSPALGDASGRIATTLFVDESLADLEQRLQAEIGTPPDLSAYAPLNSPNFTGIPTAATANPGTTTGQLATTAFVMHAVTAGTAGVSSFNTRTGAVTLTTADITGAGGALTASPNFTGTPIAPTAAPGTGTNQLATCAFVAAAITAAGGVTSFNGRSGVVTLSISDVTAAGGAPASSPNLVGTPLAPTATPGTNTTQIATTAFVTAALAAAGGVTFFNGRAGSVTLLGSDVSGAGGALVASPTFTGTPAAPTAAPGTATTQLATTAFVAAALTASGVTSFNGRTGVVTLTTADVTGAGGAPLASPGFTGVPTVPTAAPGTDNNQAASTAFVIAAIGGSVVSSFNGRTGAVTLTTADITAAGGAPLSSPSLSGTPTAPTATAGTSSTQIATTAFVAAAVSGAGVSSFNSRTGAVTLIGADVSAAGGALVASPTFTGTPAAPTPAPGDNSTTLATTAFVQAALASGAGVSSVTAGAGLTGGGTGAVTLSIPAAGVSFSMIGNFPTQTLLGRSGAGSGPGSAQSVSQIMTMLAAAPLASPTFTGTVTIPGTVTNNNAAAGVIGEYIESNVASPGSAIVNAAATNITSISLTAGDWDVAAVATYVPNSSMQVQYVVASLSLTSATLDSTFGRQFTASWPLNSAVITGMSAPIVEKRFSLAATATIYLVGYAGFTAGTMTVYGHLRARRVR